MDIKDQLKDIPIDQVAGDSEVDTEIHILKNRAGIAGKKVTLSWERPILRIQDKKHLRSM